MKKILFILPLLWVNLLTAQDYQHICTPGTTLYKSVNNDIGAFRRDSVQPSGNNDTVFISYRAIQQGISYACFDTTNGSVLGRKILKKANGWFFFFNFGLDSIRINTQAPVNGSWKFVDLPDKGYIQATVTEITNDNILGVTDPVKVITLQAKDSNNVNISHLLNQRSIKLSQHYGLSRMLNVPLIPNDTILYDLAGKSNPLLGIQELTWQQIYNYSVGDEFHYTAGEYYPINYPTLIYGYQKSEIYQVIQKETFGNDSVTYTMDYCRKDTTSYPASATRIHDTITVTYNFIKLAADNAAWFDRLPGEFINQYDFSDAYNENFTYGGSQTKTVTFGAYMNSYPFTGCWMPLTQPECPGAMISYNYSDGLGQSRYQEDCYGPGGTHTHSKWNYLVYYRKGTETWGTPVATDCSALTGVDDKLIRAGFPVRVYPNPAETETTINLDQKLLKDNLSFSLYNYSGAKVREGLFTAPVFLLERGQLSPGLYILIISDKTGIIQGKAKISFK